MGPALSPTIQNNLSSNVKEGNIHKMSHGSWGSTAYILCSQLLSFFRFWQFPMLYIIGKHTKEEDNPDLPSGGGSIFQAFSKLFACQ